MGSCYRGWAGDYHHQWQVDRVVEMNHALDE